MIIMGEAKAQDFGCSIVQMKTFKSRLRGLWDKMQFIVRLFSSQSHAAFGRSVCTAFSVYGVYSVSAASV